MNRVWWCRYDFFIWNSNASISSTCIWYDRFLHARTGVVRYSFLHFWQIYIRLLTALNADKPPISLHRIRLLRKKFDEIKTGSTISLAINVCHYMVSNGWAVGIHRRHTTITTQNSNRMSKLIFIMHSFNAAICLFGSKSSRHTPLQVKKKKRLVYYAFEFLCDLFDNTST